MSKDIRSYFTSLSAKPASSKPDTLSAKKRSISDLNASDDVIDGTPEIKPKKNSKKEDKSHAKRRRIVVISSDSETENDIKQVVPSTNKAVASNGKKKSKTETENDNKKVTPSKNKTVTSNDNKKLKIDDKITSKTVKDSSKPVDKPARKKIVNLFEAFGAEPVKQDKIPKKPISELDIHEDDDFDKTLLDLDEEELIQKAETNGEKKEEKKQVTKTSVSSDDSKITPVKKKTHETNSSTKVTPAKTATDSEKKGRKRKSNDDDDEPTMDPDLQRFEKKRYSAMLYQNYLNRSGPAHPGAKWTPKGKPDCLKGSSFVLTGVLESLTREETQALIEECGGRCTKSVSGKTNYIVLGDEAGPSKVEKARKLGVKTLSEDDLIDLICKKSGIENQNVTNKPENDTSQQNSKTTPSKTDEKTESTTTKKDKTPAKQEKPVTPTKQKEKSPTKPEKQKTPTKEKEKTPTKLEKQRTPTKEKPKPKIELISDDEDDEIPEVTTKSTAKIVPTKQNEKTPTKPEKQKTPAKEKPKRKIELISDDEDDEIPEITIKSEPTSTAKVVPKREVVKEVKLAPKFVSEKKIDVGSVAWVDKYKPEDISKIIGQQGEKSNMNKLIRWLQNWHISRTKKGITKPSPWAKDDNGAYFRAALLSGPPGVGKTTTATLVCQHLGLDTVEFNASDTRNKKMIHAEVSHILNTTSLSTYVTGSGPTKHHVLIMDEVDGMSGNEDRGGIQELISLIKTTNVPIICMCNDRQHPKMRTLANYCFDLRFAKPKLEQIRGAMLSICFKEKLTISPTSISQIIQATGQDVRQTLNQLSMLASGASADSDQVAQQANAAQKDTKLGPWEVIKKVFSEEEHKTMSFMDHSKLFFYDYSIGPLFVQENYLKVLPHCPKSEHLSRFAEAADAISMGDIVDSKIRSTQNWGLLDLQAMYASVIPGHLLRGHMAGQIDFPSWLGKNSKATKFQRMFTEIHAHTRISTSCNRTSVSLDLVKPLRDALVMPLLQNGSEGIPDALEVMRTYNLLREDLTSLVEVAHWPRVLDPYEKVDSKVKAAFTRVYNKEAPALPYAVPSAGVFKKRAAAASSEEMYGEEDEAIAESDEEKDDDLNNDGMIKMKKAVASKAAASKAPKASSSKGKATTKGGRGGKRGK